MRATAFILHAFIIIHVLCWAVRPPRGCTKSTSTKTLPDSLSPCNIQVTHRTKNTIEYKINSVQCFMSPLQTTTEQKNRQSNAPKSNSLLPPEAHATPQKLHHLMKIRVNTYPRWWKRVLRLSDAVRKQVIQVWTTGVVS